MENSKMQEELGKLRKGIASGMNDAQKILTDQFDALQDELVRRREECVQLRSILSQNVGQINIEKINDVTETQDYALAFKAQKEINR